MGVKLGDWDGLVEDDTEGEADKVGLELEQKLGEVVEVEDRVEDTLTEPLPLGESVEVMQVEELLEGDAV